MGRYGIRGPRIIYVQMKMYDPKIRRAVHVKGKALKFQGWSPDEAADIIEAAFKRAEAEERERLDGAGKAAGIPQRPEDQGREEG